MRNVLRGDAETFITWLQDEDDSPGSASDQMGLGVLFIIGHLGYFDLCSGIDACDGLDNVYLNYFTIK